MTYITIHEQLDGKAVDWTEQVSFADLFVTTETRAVVALLSTV